MREEHSRVLDHTNLTEHCPENASKSSANRSRKRSYQGTRLTVLPCVIFALLCLLCSLHSAEGIVSFFLPGWLERIRAGLLRTTPPTQIARRQIAINDVLEDAELTTPELIRKYGYESETHNVETEDGYHLTLHRIPRGLTERDESEQTLNGNGSLNSAPRPAVFLQHCILCSSSVFVLMGPKKGLGFLLADQGYDVWMGNARGTIYSRGHTNMSTSSKAYWKFSWHEMGVYDLPASIDYILRETEQKKLFYIGHSMGTTMMYVLLSVRPEYNHKLRLMVSLSPVAFMSNIKSPLFRILYGPVSNAMNTVGVHEFIPGNTAVTTLGRQLCQEKALTSTICSNILFLIAGYDSRQLNRTMLPVIFGHLPDSTSTNSLMHYGQSVQNGDFKWFDYGQKTNMKIYRQEKPPPYRLSKITAPVALFFSDNDWLADKKDIGKLAKKLKNIVSAYRVPLNTFNHMDYLFAMDVKELVYDNVLTLLSNY
ncbi:lipase 3 [Nilaparvata lugens]|uniref:lipase 3 n=1 Tax=Nilaparvata lugens TaxID=108931 RepID=UPI00193D710B|nr:lipase 3 [Nilaparvata lugens]XP_022187147.2 lipase 3 [Nilaparvata lugens]XP_022187148.2 lipase 3 [Nilaparvata lugens]XP_039290724.1 lipase 3 [Nilaparvata lugens]